VFVEQAPQLPRTNAEALAQGVDVGVVQNTIFD
jgi:hypothetical protein